MTLQRRLLMAALALAVVWVLGIVGYMTIEGWGFLDAAYMTVITLASVGFMEVHDLGPGGRIFTIFLIIGGMGSLLYGVSTATAFIVEGELKDILRRRKMEKRIAAVQGHTIVCGVGGVGRYVLEELHKTRRPFVVVDEDHQRLQTLAKAESFLWLEGAPTDDGVLRAAGIERAAGLVSALETDQDNLFVVLTARNLNPQLRIVALAVEEESTHKLRVAGADEAISANRIGGLRLASLLIRPAAVTFLDKMLRHTAQTLRVEDVRIPEGSRVAGMTVGQADLGRQANSLMLAIRRRGEEDYRFNPPADTVLQPEDVLVFVGEVERLEALRRSLGS